jgi:hypothetical protein
LLSNATCTATAGRIKVGEFKDTDVGHELEAMERMSEGEGDASSAAQQASVNRINANELFERIHMARYVTTNATKEKWVKVGSVHKLKAVVTRSACANAW